MMTNKRRSTDDGCLLSHGDGLKFGVGKGMVGNNHSFRKRPLKNLQATSRDKLERLGEKS